MMSYNSKEFVRTIKAEPSVSTFAKKGIQMNSFDSGPSGKRVRSGYDSSGHEIQPKRKFSDGTSETSCDETDTSGDDQKRRREISKRMKPTEETNRNREKENCQNSVNTKSSLAASTKKLSLPPTSFGFELIKNKLKSQKNRENSSEEIENTHELLNRLTKTCKIMKRKNSLIMLPNRLDPEVKFRELVKGETFDRTFMPRPLTVDKMDGLENIYNFSCVICSETNPKDDAYRGFFLGLGGSNIYKFDMRTSKWIKLDADLELPTDTLFYAELIWELTAVDGTQSKTYSLHIIDALVLGGNDVRKLAFYDRLKECRKLAKAVNESSPSFVPVKVKNAWSLTKISQLLNNSLVVVDPKKWNGIQLLSHNGDNCQFVPIGLMIFEIVSSPWVLSYSKTKKSYYYFNTKDGNSSYKPSENSIANFKQCFYTRKFWRWSKNVHLVIKPSQTDPDKSLIHSYTMKKLVHQRFFSTIGYVPPECI